MGWKSVKEHYRIGHSVQVTEQGICIGSPYIHDLIVIGLDGEIKKRDGMSNDDLKRYLQEMDADPEKLKSLVQAEDTFERSIPVFTYDYSGNILEKQCEEPGWPNQTHDGQMMYDNTFSESREKVIYWANQELKAAASMAKDRIEQIRQELADAERRLSDYETALERLSKTK